MKIFLDANVLFSGAKKGSPMAQLLEVLSRKADLVSSVFAVEEAKRNLVLKYSQYLPHFRKLLRKMDVIQDATLLRHAGLPEKDWPILSGAVGADATHLLTGDFQHFGKFMGEAIHGIKIVSAKILVQEIQAKGWLK